MFFFQAVDEHTVSEADNGDVDTDDIAADDSDGHSNDENDGDTDAELDVVDDDDDDDDDEFVDAGDEVEGITEQAPWVTERRHSGDGEVRIILSPPGGIAVSRVLMCVCWLACLFMCS